MSPSQWGPPTWIFMHTLAAKIKEEQFPVIGPQVISHLIQICMFLPCPECSDHAKQFWANVNTKNIKTKQDLINLLFVFHNSVNKRKNLPIFPYSELKPKYEKAIFINIVNHFMHFYKMEHHAVRLMSEDMYRRRSAKSILDWLHTNQDIFDK